MPGYFDTGFNSFSMFETFFMIIFVLILCVVGYTIITGIMEWNKNNNSPRLKVWAKVVTKRADVSHYHNEASASANHMSSSTTYYVTFEVESGDRMELHVSGSEYGMLVEGDTGHLSFQGTRYLSFDRE